MPRGKTQNGKRSKPDVNAGRKYFCPAEAPWGGFINLRVSADERADFDGWSTEEAANLGVYLADQLVEGLKLTLSYDAENSAYTATFTGAGCVGIPDRCCLTAKGKDADEALNLLLYKHLVLLDGDWGGYLPATGRVQFG